jgi:hypothetical protein
MPIATLEMMSPVFPVDERERMCQRFADRNANAIF